MKNDGFEIAQDTLGFDRAFYSRVASARGNAGLRQCRMIASRSRDEKILRAFVAAMFTTRSHRKEISRCIRNYIGKRAIPALLWNLQGLPPDRRMFQSRLLCILGHYDSFDTYYYALEELLETSASTDELANIRKSVQSFLGNYAPKLLPAMRRALTSGQAGLILFCAPYLYKYEPQEVSARLGAIARDRATTRENQEESLRLLTAFSPEIAVDCLLDSGGNYPLPSIISTLSRLATGDEGKTLLPVVVDEFSKHDDQRRLAAILFSQRQDTEAREVQFLWITEQLQNWDNAGVEDMPPDVRSVANRLCLLDHPDWVRYLESTAQAQGNPLAEFARSVLISTEHPAGLRLLRQEISLASGPEDLFRPCIDAVRTYREEAVDVLETVSASGHARLTDRVQHAVSRTWPGKTIAEILDAHKDALQSSVRSDTLATMSSTAIESSPATTPTVRIPQRRERITTVYARDRAIVRDVKTAEEYCCQLCGRRMVNARNGEPYAESHHVHPLGHEGSDTIENLLCVCSLCHALLHLGCVGVDRGLRIHLANATKNEVLLPTLRVAAHRDISRSALRHHWTVLFLAPEDARFDERDPEDD